MAANAHGTWRRALLKGSASYRPSGTSYRPSGTTYRPSTLPTTNPGLAILPILGASAGSSGGGGDGGSPAHVSTILIVLGSLVGLLVLLALLSRLSQCASQRGFKLLRPSTWRAAASTGGPGAGVYLQRQSNKEALAALPPAQIGTVLVMMPDDQVQCAIKEEPEQLHPAAPAPQAAGEAAAPQSTAAAQAAQEVVSIQVVELAELPEEDAIAPQQQQVGARLSDAGSNLAASIDHSSGCGGSGSENSGIGDAQRQQQQQSAEAPCPGLSAAAPASDECKSSQQHQT